MLYDEFLIYIWILLALIKRSFGDHSIWLIPKVHYQTLSVMAWDKLQHINFEWTIIVSSAITQNYTSLNLLVKDWIFRTTWQKKNSISSLMCPLRNNMKLVDWLGNQLLVILKMRFRGIDEMTSNSEWTSRLKMY